MHGRLGLLAIVLSLASGGALLLSAEPRTGAGIAAAFHAITAVAFAAPLWSVVAALCAGLVALALGLRLADWALRRRPREARLSAGPAPGAKLKDAIAEIRGRVEASTERRYPDIVLALDELLQGALFVEASDVHLSPTGRALELAYRVQGALVRVAQVRPELGPEFATRVKVLSRLDPFLRDTPQDDRLQRQLGESALEARVSTLPTEFGERLVLRLVRGGRSVPALAELGLPEHVHRGLVELLARPQGLLFVTGSVGSGKSTTLYGCLEHIARTRGQTTTIVTLEDPIELQLPFATQTQIHARGALTFAGALRSVLRQDPNVLMIGEIRDRETAEIAVQAGLTGHLILTTVHGSSSAGTFARLCDFGIEPFILASAALGSLSQRLLRTLCPACRRRSTPTAAERARVAALGLELPEGDYYDAIGCDHCEGQGFVGRAAVAELLVVDDTLRDAIQRRLPTAELHALAVQRGHTPLADSALGYAVRGQTSLDEVLRVAG